MTRPPDDDLSERASSPEAEHRIDAYEHHRCANCEDPLTGRFCATCGQRADTRVLSVGQLLKDTLDEQLSVNSALPHTLRLLVTKPGALTTEYTAGRIVRYIAPFRLYLICSILFFVLVALRTDYDQIVADIDRSTASAITRADSAQKALADTIRAEMARSAPAAADSARGAGADAAADGENAGVQIEDGKINVNFPIDTTGLPPWQKTLARRLKRQEDRVNRLQPAEAMRLFLVGIEQNTPKVIFLILPLYALILKLLYIRRKRYYVEHFVFALHVHSFVFLLLCLTLFVNNGLFTALTVFWILGYTFLAMRRAYGQSRVKTALKWLALGLSYTILLTLVTAVTIFFTVMTI